MIDIHGPCILYCLIEFLRNSILKNCVYANVWKSTFCDIFGIANLRSVNFGLFNAKFRRIVLKTTSFCQMFVFYNFLAYWLSASLENFQYFINKNLADSANIVLLKITYICILFSKIYIYLVGGEEPGRVPALRYRPTVLPGGEDIRHAGTSDGTSPQSRARAFLDSPSLCALFLKAPCTSRYLRTSHSFSRHH